MTLDRKKIFWAGLAVYAVILFLFLTFSRLPADQLIAATTAHATQGRLNIEAKKIAPILPLGYRLEDVSCVVQLGEITARDRLKSLTLRTDLPRLLAGYLPVRFACALQRGHLAGKTGASLFRGPRKGYLSIDAAEVYLEDSNILQSLSRRALTGRLQAGVTIKGDMTDPSQVSGEGRILWEQGSIGTKLSIPGLEAVPFDAITLAFSAENGKVTLKESDMKGPMFSGSLAGEIRLAKKITRSQVRIEARLTPGPLLQDNEMASQFLAKSRKGPLIITVRGTLERPSISWRKS
jgi:type II secretion system protein N